MRGKGEGSPAADSNRLKCGTYYMHQILLGSTLAHLYSSRIKLSNPPAMMNIKLYIRQFIRGQRLRANGE